MYTSGYTLIFTAIKTGKLPTPTGLKLISLQFTCGNREFIIVHLFQFVKSLYFTILNFV